MDGGMNVTAVAIQMRAGWGSSECSAPVDESWTAYMCCWLAARR
jgi:hypothetical protein